ncbi:hypothetical protein PSA7680_02807 [Pseudoruegeria aquimaris]|uniref:Outer membrane protein beta-barrel domain-containing protein n=1 Tax=Pseudoruegeria aquimaris TaxID=393663 RepID=A0A1Y5T4D4_9RHOB|nr:hypothetical protein [Pseudoruegeria aquimaris]SLN53763.1 hypothetical protein PSA7680_02807 [Pseudoruegeria aquimaris]
MRRTSKTLLKTLPALLAAALFTLEGSGATAQPAPGALSSDGWQHSVTPFLFLPLATTGTSTIDGNATDLDLDLGDIFDLLQGAASIRYEGWKGRYGIIAEGYYTNLGLDQALPGPTVTRVEVDARQSFLALQGAYRVNAGVNAAGRPFATDLAFGVKWNRLKQEVTGTGGGGGTATIGGTEDWFEPVITARYSVEVADDWIFGARAELSGFGVNGNDLAYLALVGFSWQKWENTALRFGYQFYGIDFSTERAGGTFAYDVNQHGPYLGLTFNF